MWLEGSAIEEVVEVMSDRENDAAGKRDSLVLIKSFTHLATLYTWIVTATMLLTQLVYAFLIQMNRD